MSLPIPSGQYPDKKKDTITRMRNASATSDFRKTSANPHLRRRRSRRRPRQRRLSPEVKWWIFQLFFLFRVCVFVGLLAFLHSKGIGSPIVYMTLANLFHQMATRMPPPPAVEDDGSNYTLQA